MKPIQELTRRGIERRLRDIVAQHDKWGYGTERLDILLERLKHSPKIAYTAIENLANSQIRNDWWEGVGLGELDKEMITSAPDIVYEFIAERANESTCGFQVAFASKAMEMLMQSQRTRNDVYRLFTTEKVENATIDDCIGAIRAKFQSGWMKKESPHEKNHYLGPEDHLHHIIKNLNGLGTYSTDILDIIAENIESFYPHDVVFGLVGLMESEGISQGSLRVLKKLTLQQPEHMQIFCRSMVPLDGSDRLYESLDKWTDSDPDSWWGIDDLPQWIAYYKSAWVKYLDGNGWLKIHHRNPKMEQKMRNAFHHFFTGKRKRATMDDVLNSADYIIEKNNWRQNTFLKFSYNLSEIAELPEVWGFVRDEAINNKVIIGEPMLSLCKIARVQAVSQEARKETYRLITGEEKEDVSLDEALQILENNRWANIDVANLCKPYWEFIRAGAPNACYLVPKYKQEGWNEGNILGVAKTFLSLGRHSKGFYQSIEGLCGADVKKYIEVYHAFPDFSPEKRNAIIRYLRVKGDEELTRSMQDVFGSEHYTKFHEWKKQLTHFKDVTRLKSIGIEGLVDLLSKTSSLFDRLRYIGAQEELYEITFDPQKTLSENCRMFQHRIGELSQKYKYFQGTRTSELNRAYNALEGTFDNRIELLRWLKDNAKDVEAISHMKEYEEELTEKTEWLKRLSYFGSGEIEAKELSRLIAKSSRLFGTLRGVHELDELFSVKVDRRRKPRNNYALFSEKIDIIYEKYRDLAESDWKLSGVYNVLSGFSRQKRFSIVHSVKDNAKAIDDLTKLYPLKDDDDDGYREKLGYFESIEDTRLIDLLIKVGGIGSLLGSIHQQERLTKIQLRCSGNVEEDYQRYKQSVRDIGYDLVEEVLGSHIDRDSFIITPEVLEIAKGYQTRKDETTRDLYRKFLKGETRLTLAEIASIANTSIADDKKEMLKEWIADYERGTDTIPLKNILKLTSIKEEEKGPHIITSLISDYRQGLVVPKAFPLGREYSIRPISGMKERRNPVEMTELLVYGLISRNPDKVMRAGEKFDHDLLQRARSHVSDVETFNNIRDHLEGLKAGDPESAKRVLGYFEKRYGDTEPVMDLVQGVEGLFQGQENFDYLSCRMQQGTILDIFDSTRLMCCTFSSSGSEKTPSLFYLLDENTGLLHLVPLIGGEYQDPIGVAILANCTDDKGRKVLLVDSVEGGSQVDRLRENEWKTMVYGGIQGVAQDNNADGIAFNLSTGGTKPMKFNNYVRNMTGAPGGSTFLRKIGGPEVLRKYDISGHGLEAFRESPDLQGKVSCLLVPTG